MTNNLYRLVLYLTPEDFAEKPGTQLEKQMLEIEQAQRHGHCLAYHRIDGDFYYDGQYYSADIIIPVEHWFKGGIENDKKLFAAVIYNLPYGEGDDLAFDHNKITDPKFGEFKPVFMHELEQSQREYDAQFRKTLLKHAELDDKKWQLIKEEALNNALSHITKH